MEERGDGGGERGYIEDCGVRVERKGLFARDKRDINLKMIASDRMELDLDPGELWN